MCSGKKNLANCICCGTLHLDKEAVHFFVFLLVTGALTRCRVVFVAKLKTLSRTQLWQQQQKRNQTTTFPDGHEESAADAHALWINHAVAEDGGDCRVHCSSSLGQDIPDTWGTICHTYTVQ